MSKIPIPIRQSRRRLTVLVAAVVVVAGCLYLLVRPASRDADPPMALSSATPQTPARSDRTHPTGVAGRRVELRFLEPASPLQGTITFEYRIATDTEDDR